jgi:hypothetical protein
MTTSDPTPDAWAALIRADLRRTIEGIIKAGQHLEQARPTIGNWEAWLRGSVGISPATASKLTAIARHPVLGDLSHAKALPTSSETLYLLTRVPDLAARIEAGEVTPDTSREMAALMAEPAKPKAEPIELKVIQAKAEPIRVELKATPAKVIPAEPRIELKPKAKRPIDKLTPAQLTKATNMYPRSTPTAAAAAWLSDHHTQRQMDKVAKANAADGAPEPEVKAVTLPPTTLLHRALDAAEEKAMAHLNTIGPRSNLGKIRSALEALKDYCQPEGFSPDSGDPNGRSFWAWYWTWEAFADAEEICAADSGYDADERQSARDALESNAGDLLTTIEEEQEERDADAVRRVDTPDPEHEHKWQEAWVRACIGCGAMQVIEDEAG